MSWPNLSCWWTICSLVVVGCTSGTDQAPQGITYNGGGGARTSIGDIAKGPDVAGAGAVDAGGQSGSGGADAGCSAPAIAGCPCVKHSDCANGACDSTNAEGICVDPCAGTFKIIEACDGLDNNCDGATDEAACEDENPCTDDTCDAVKGCLHAHNKATCDDGSACSVADQCDNGLCKGASQQCDDKNVCTTDSCQPTSGCIHQPNALSCNDGNKCTGADACNKGACKGTALKCDDGNKCTVDSCDGQKGCVHDGNKSPCSDGNGCTTDSCDPIKGCVFVAKSGSCNDGDACTVGDNCSGNKCAGKLKLAKPACKVCIDARRAPPNCDKCLPKFKGPKCEQCADSNKTGANCDKSVSIPNNDYCKEVINWTSSWTKLEDAIVVLVNSYRAKGATCGGKKYGKAGPLTMQSGLRCAARKHSKDMVVSKFFSHTNKKGESPFTRIKKTGYSFSTAGENIAAGNSSAAKTMQQWMKSPGHCANIMNPKYTQIGVGYYKGGKWGHMWTQTFGKPK